MKFTIANSMLYASLLVSGVVASPRAQQPGEGQNPSPTTGNPQQPGSPSPSPVPDQPNPTNPQQPGTTSTSTSTSVVSIPTVIPDEPTVPRDACSGNTASTRSEWCDYSIETDYSSVVPDTGVTREYWFEVTDTTVSPDGVSRVAMAINGSFPGPTIIADWGDTVVVHVTNSLETSLNGTSIHFHGIRQNYTNQHDGVPSVTQCPTAVGESMTYTWRATQYGTTWYHSHFSLQAWNGVLGGILINGPASANYDEDLGHIFLNDWDHQTPDELYDYAQKVGPPTLDNALINGTNVYNETGSRFTTSWESGTTYRLRLVNGAIDTHFKFMVDNHTMTVIAADLVPIVPYTTDYINVGIGQRYDVLITADQADVADQFWMRAIPQAACSDVATADNILGIVTYIGDTTTEPTTVGYDYADSCDDETENLVPYVSKTVGSAELQAVEDASITLDGELFKWTLNATTLLTDWASPTLMQVLDGSDTFDASDNVIHLAEANEWFYLVIETSLAVTHPIHLHGHDFFILAQGTDTYDAADVTLNLDNPPRRDVAMLPASGYLVLAWETDNPGVWLMHCHIGWHTSEGFALQFVERYSEISNVMDTSFVSDQCDAWATFQDDNSIEQIDSGI